MRKFGIGVAATLVVASGAAPAMAEELVLERVLLTTGGVGYFEHEATVTGDAELSLEVSLDQVSDVLKSIVILDEKNRLGRASLPGREPLAEALRDLPFSIDDLASPASLLRALRGAMVRITLHGTTIEGRVLSVVEETVSLGEGRGTITRNRITLLTPAGMRQAILEEAEGIEIVDPALRADVERALAAIVEHGAKERRTITIEVPGEGERKVRVGYVIATPLWKATYRLVLPPQGDEARIEGWALLENMSGQDWNDVSLSVVSGNPVTLRQAIYEAYYVNRPLVPVEVFGRILPPIDVGAVPIEESDGADLSRRFLSRGPMAAGMAAAESASRELTPPLQPDEPAIAEAVEAETQVVFHFPDPIDLPRGESLLAPIVNRSIEAERVSVYRHDVSALHPLASVNLSNENGTSLPPGVLAMYEEASEEGGSLVFVGDARLGALPAGESRLVSYAADLAVRVDREEKIAQRISAASIDRGVLRVRRVERRATEYKIAGAKDEARVIILEHPRMTGFDLVAPTEGVIGETPEFYRIRREVAAGQTLPVEVVLERPIDTTFSIPTMSGEELNVFLSGAELPPNVHAALTRVAELRRTVASREMALTQLETERKKLVADQERLRQNLAVAPGGSELHGRYLAALTATEDRIQELDRMIDSSRESVRLAKEELADFIASLSI